MSKIPGQEIISWADIVEKEKKEASSSSKPNLEDWLSSLQKSPELLNALKKSILPSQNTTNIAPSPQIANPYPVTISQIPKNQKKQISQYFQKPGHQNIITIEDGFYHESPHIALAKIFPEGWFFKPWELMKSREYYIAILEFTGSAKFKDFFLKNDPTNPAYSTCHIQKIIHPSEWGQDLSVPKSFPVNFEFKILFCTIFSYWDYQQAWYNVFFVQNQKFSHT